MSRKPDYTRFAKIKGSSRTSLREVILLTSVCSFCRAAPVAEDRTGTYPNTDVVRDASEEHVLTTNLIWEAAVLVHF